MELIGYHGTTEKSAKDIINNGINLKSKKWLNDMGNGFYTYVKIDDLPFDPIKNAIKYAKTFKPKSKLAIIQVKIEVEESSVLALITEDKKRELFALFQQIEQLGRKELGIPEKLKTGASKRNNQDGYMIEYLIKHQLILEPKVILETTHTDFDHVRSNFDNGVEMVIRDLSVIKEKKLIKL